MNKSILLVDDEEIIRKSFYEDLSDEGYEVTTAENGEIALELLGRNSYSLVITDLMMEGVDGLKVLEEVKRIDPDIGVIIITGFGDMASAIKALRLGADDYLLKPCDIDELLIRISRCIEKREAKLKIKLYEDILPVCMYCKSIRDDAGKKYGEGSWLSLEEYIHQKSGTQLSHGCCPVCFEIHKDD